MDKTMTYLLFIIPLGLLVFEYYSYQKNKKSGNGYVFKPLKLIAELIVMAIALYAIITGKTYEDILDLINEMFRK
ncbi:hypothetical protein [Miniphocaeibacter massiliensis]|uniref:hypothetical protein n=1 Tax=Miniphocaeibacter massiliensis TaxID=2041841 RepID=UPI000C1B970D|nr:hypothetical protein [Miniphocaeibacter massiliensis]